MITDLDIGTLPWPEQEDLRARQRSQAPQDQQRGDAAPPGQPSPDGVPPDQASGRLGSDPAPSVRPGSSTDGAGPASGSAAGRAARPGGDKARVIRHATAPTPRPPAADSEQDEDVDEHFIPPPPPPLPRLDPVAKGAWTALLGGPAYLLVASMAGWFVPGWAALAAVAAFVGGFTVVVIRLGDGSSRGAGPDNGAIL
jgi:hypothetical protein